MIITEIQYFSSKIIRFQAIFKDTVEFTCALEFKISSQQNEPFEQKTDIKAALQHLIVLISPQPYPYVYLPITFVSMMTVPEHCRILF